MYQIRFRLEAPPQTLLGELTSPDSIAGFKGPISKGKRGGRAGGKGKGWERREGRGERTYF